MIVRRLIITFAFGLLFAGGLLPVEVPVVRVLAPQPTEARGIGSSPLDDILYWADQKKSCGLSRDQLAGIMMAPMYPETGASAENAPSPMTLGRWDTQAKLYAFEDKSTPWQKAFWHAGIGMWQFDSAGGWDLTGADAISTWSSAQQAATTMVQRWCTNPSRAYVWGLWYGCATGNVCEDIYNTIFDGSKLRNLTLDRGVAREGGMEQRSCTFGGVSTSCWYVDPARAQGWVGWRCAGCGPSPLTAPFYVIRANGREYRFWLKDDTGYPATIRADKPVTANARTSLAWSTSTELCDVSLGRGDCGAGPRVATTPWGDRTANPFGSFDAAVSSVGSAWLSGWAIDPDTNDPVMMHLYVDGTFAGWFPADGSRPDVAAVIPGYGDRHGINFQTGRLGSGTHTLCLYAMNAAPHGNVNAMLGCRSVTIAANPIGVIDSVDPFGNGMRVKGWALDADSSDPIVVHVWVDGAYASQGVSNTSRPDVGQAFPWAGPNRGYQIDVPAAPGNHSVCVWGVNVGPGTYTPFACRTVNVPDRTPFGSFDLAARVPGGVRVAGWAIDPDSQGPIDVHIYVNGGFAASIVAGLSRPDVGAAFPSSGPNHGFDATVAAPGGSVQVCVYAINVGAGWGNPQFGCRTVS